MIFVGMLIVFTLGLGTPVTEENMLNSEYWRLMLGFPIVISGFQTILLLAFFRYETPIYSLITKNDEASARNVLSNSLSLNFH